MAEVVYELEDGEQLTVALREPHWAALLAWLWPGAGHFYQRRFAKGFLFMICVLSIFFLGLFWGGGRVVYASFKPEDFRWQFFCQLGVGLPAFPAVIQAVVAKPNQDPLWIMAERYPQVVIAEDRFRAPVFDQRSFRRIKQGEKPPEGVRSLKDGFMAAPDGNIYLDRNDVLGMWHVELGHFFEIGTVYTLVAGLLNLLAIYDAYVGPVIIKSEDEEKDGDLA